MEWSQTFSQLLEKIRLPQLGKIQKNQETMGRTCGSQHYLVSLLSPKRPQRVNGINLRTPQITKIGERKMTARLSLGLSAEPPRRMALAL